jgi:hypothetical protein
MNPQFEHGSPGNRIALHWLHVTSLALWRLPRAA